MPEILLEDIHMERFRLCLAEIAGVKHTWKSAPGQKIVREDTPAAYPLTGPTWQPTQNDRGTLRIGRQFGIRLLICPFDGKPESLEEGNEANILAQPFFTRVHLYFGQHPNLHTETLPPLTYCQGIFGIVDSGLVPRPAPGGTQMAAIDFTLNVLMAMNMPRVSIPYPV